jgi:FMN reductase
MKLAIVLGAATPPGRLARAVTAMAELARGPRPDLEVAVVDLATVKVETCDGRPLEAYADQTREAVRAVAEADGVILATPVYRATYTGVLKNLLDLLPLEAIQDKPVGILAMGATPHHYLGVDGQLRAVLAWFGALVAPTAVYLTGQDFHEGQPSEAATDELRALVGTVVTLAERLGGAPLGPTPLAGRGRS